MLLFAGGHSLLAATAAMIAVVRRPNGAGLIAVSTLLTVAAISGVALLVAPGASSFEPTLHIIQERNGTAIVVLGLGCSTALPWFLSSLSPLQPTPSSRPSLSLTFMLVACTLATLVGSVGALAYRDRHPQSPREKGPMWELATRNLWWNQSPASLRASLTARRAHYPICVAVDEQDRVFVSVQCSHAEDYSGKIVQLVETGLPGRTVHLKTVADDPCLFRTFGLAARDDHIFVSRSGVFVREDGRIEYENSGVITRLSDLDRDGMMDYYEDVVVGLPGCQGPVPQHSNNAIAFGPDGSLYITQGVHSDRAPLTHPWRGRSCASPDFKKVTVFAKGLRNPFGLVFGTDEQLFATDNDVTIGNPGDELNLIKEGSHYGHPYVVGDSDGGGKFVKPLSTLG